MLVYYLLCYRKEKKKIKNLCGFFLACSSEMIVDYIHRTENVRQCYYAGCTSSCYWIPFSQNVTRLHADTTITSAVINVLIVTSKSLLQIFFSLIHSCFSLMFCFYVTFSFFFLNCLRLTVFISIKLLVLHFLFAWRHHWTSHWFHWYWIGMRFCVSN